MGVSPITFPLFLSQAINLLVTLAWLVLLGFALRSLRYRALSDAAKALWAGLILLIPFLGAIAFWIVVPSQRVAQVVVPSGRRLLPGPEPWEPHRTPVDAKGVDFGQNRQRHSAT